MKKLLKYFYKKTILGHFIIGQLIKVYNFYLYRIISEKSLLKRNFRRSFNREIDFDNPETLNEKIMWLMLNDRTPLHTVCADKFAVRSYINSKIGGEHLVPLFFQTENPMQITPENIPDIPCIIKTNHDSGGGIIVKNKSEIDWEHVRKSLKNRLKVNYYYRSKEWQYKNIEPCIIVEKLLMDKKGELTKDYKMHCFNGIVEMLQVDIGRFSGNHCRNFYNKKWEREPYSWASPKEGGKLSNPSEEDVEKPKTLDKMISLSEILSKDFFYSRIDWYEVDGALYFGEITFHTDGGKMPILPQEWDKKLGGRLKLPIN